MQNQTPSTEELFSATTSAAAFVQKVREALGGVDSLGSTAIPFRSEVRDEAVSALHTAESLYSQALSDLQRVPELLVALRQEVEALTYPTATDGGAAYDSLLTGAGLSNRSTNALKYSGITTVRQLCQMDMSDVMKLRNFGKVSFDEVVAYREKIGAPMKR